MTTAGLDAPPILQPAFGSIRARTWTTVVVHGIVDFFSYVLIPLMPLLAARLDLRASQVAFTIALGSIAGGIVQPAVAWASDRLDTRWLGTLGFAAAVVSFGLIGYVTSYPQLLLVQLIGAAGVGAFHPVAAAAVGQLARANRALGVAVFFMGGMLGGLSGSLLSPLYVRLLGLPALAWLIVPGMAAVAALAWAIHSVPHLHAGAHADHRTLPQRERAWRWRAVWFLYIGNVLRFTVNMALVQLIIEWSQRHTLGRAGAAEMTTALGERAASLNGMMQGAMQIGMGAAGLGAGFLLARGTERRALLLVPLVGAAAIAAFPMLVSTGDPGATRGVATVASFLLMTIAGIGFGGVIPVSISLAQRLLPHRTSLASSLMMGGGWMVAAVGPPLAERLTASLGLGGAFYVVAGLLLVSGLMALTLPAWLMAKLAH